MPGGKVSGRIELDSEVTTVSWIRERPVKWAIAVPQAYFLYRYIILLSICLAFGNYVGYSITGIL